MKICVQGLWHLGTVTAACLASVGHQVIGLDFDIPLIERLNQGTPPLFEPGLAELITTGLASNNLRFSCSIEEALLEAEILWVTYDTPVNEEDQADVDFVVAQIERALAVLPVNATIIISSQMPVGSIQRLENSAESKFPNKHFSFACSPENLRLGKALEVFLQPDRIIMGIRSEHDQLRLKQLLNPITDRIEWMSVESAEMTKHAINAFLATSVTFANEIASLCEWVGADAKEVERGLKTETRIGPKAYLSPGAAFAGGTLARDITFLNKLSQEKHLTTPLLSAVKPSNDEHKQWVKRKLRSVFPELTKTVIAIWGLTYKAGTDTLRRSMAVELCDWLIEQGATVHAHDPVVKDLPQRWTGKKIQLFDDPLIAAQNTHALIIATEWPIYRQIDVDQLPNNKFIVLDANRFASHLAKSKNIHYIAVGTPEKIQHKYD